MGVDGDECLYYVVTAAKPTVVTHARVGRFLAPDRQHLLLARLNRVDVYEVDATADSVEDGERGVLRACLELPVYGRVVALEALPGDAVAGKRAGASRLKETSTSTAGGTSSDAGHQKRARTDTRAYSSQRIGAADAPSRTAAADDELATDVLFLLTEALHFAVLRYDAASCLVETVARGSVRSKIGKPCTRGQFVAVDPEYRCIALHVYESVLKIIPGHWGSEAFDVRIDALEVQSLVFLKGTATPTLAILHADYTRNRHLLTYEVLLEERDLREGPCSYTYLDSSAELLFAVPPVAGTAAAAGGVVIAGDQSLTLYAGVGDHVKRVITLPNDERVSMRCVTPLPTDEDALLSGAAAVDVVGQEHPGCRFLLSDQAGLLYLLQIDREMVMRLECVGEANAASTMAYLGHGHVFVGSACGDSQLIRLQPPPLSTSAIMPATTPYRASSSIAPSASARRTPSTTPHEAPALAVQVLQNYTHLGPIQDFVVTDVGAAGQGQMITCSGVSHCGSLRVVRNGIGITEHASMELRGIKGLFALKRRPTDEHHELLLVSFAAETRVLRMTDDDELEEVESSAAAEPTLLAATLPDRPHIVWVTPTAVRLYGASLTDTPLAEWNAPAAARISAATLDESTSALVLATPDGHLHQLRVSRRGDSIAEVARAQLPAEVASLHAAGGLVVAGTWSDAGVRLLRQAPGGGTRTPASPAPMPLLHTQTLPPHSLPRSVLLTRLPAEGDTSSPWLLLIAFGDGRLFTYTLQCRDSHHDDDDHHHHHHVADTTASATLTDLRHVTLGVRPPTLCELSLQGTRCIFAACDRPTVIQAVHGRLVCSSVNLREVTRIVRLHTRAFPDAMVVATEHGLLLGSIEPIQQLHIRKYPLGEQPRRIAHLPGCFCLLTISVERGEERHHVRLLDDVSFERRASFDLPAREHALSLLAVRRRDVFVVGSATVRDTEIEPQHGRLWVFAKEGLLLLAEQEVRGAPYALAAFGDEPVAQPMISTAATEGDRAYPLLDRYLAAGVNNSVVLLEWTFEAKSGERGLRPVCSHYGNVVVLKLEARGQLLLVGDLMKSVCVLRLLLPPADDWEAVDGERHSDRRPENGGHQAQLEALAWDRDTCWVVSCAFLTDDTYLLCDNAYNLLCLRRNADEVREEFRVALERIGAFHLGDLVNVFRRGSLVMEVAAPAVATSSITMAAAAAAAANGGAEGGTSTAVALRPPHTALLFGTVSGAIGMVVAVDRTRFAMLSRLEAVLRGTTVSLGEPGSDDRAPEHIVGIGGLQHAEWRAPFTDRTAGGTAWGLGATAAATAGQRGIIDGDLVERYLDLHPSEMQQVARQMGTSADPLTAVVEEMARLHS